MVLNIPPSFAGGWVVCLRRGTQKLPKPIEAVWLQVAKKFLQTSTQHFGRKGMRQARQIRPYGQHLISKCQIVPFAWQAAVSAAAFCVSVCGPRAGPSEFGVKGGTTLMPAH